ncbi:hypothetical protein DERF_004793 [Dermatophagoides farinae]|uniref:Uncharacterized protein n=1 Tax=Dermatophagoides farinae TaxID=6954 RepID=A0A922I2P9_DERFA|nr:hypothetical protein DERF_004793 [Dermatophagoides farinae]
MLIKSLIQNSYIVEKNICVTTVIAPPSSSSSDLFDRDICQQVVGLVIAIAISDDYDNDDY